jgi:hypothetical protein
MALDTPTRKPNLSKKTVLGVLAAAIALAYAGSTWWAGNKVKSVYDSAFAELPQQSALVRVTERSYERGFLGAVSTVTLELGCPADAAVAGAPPADPDEEDGEEAAPTPSRPLRLSFRDTILHGPLAGGSLAAATIDSELLLDIKAQAEARKVFGDARPFGAHTRVGFDGGYASEITLAPGQFADEGKTRVSWQGAQLRVRVDGARTEAHYELALPGFEAADLRNGVNLKMGKLGARADLDIRHGWMLATGKSAGRLDALEFTVAGKKADAEVSASIDRTVSWAGWCDKYPMVMGSRHPVAGPYHNFSMPEPSGVCVCVHGVAEKHPLLGFLSLVLPPLCAGNAVVAVANLVDKAVLLLAEMSVAILVSKDTVMVLVSL